ncbi:hypothetical protein BDY19DRAFT_993606 [Irpex rosettiformis]|uniref:Uncharacterized protein n=1 Tax=Irpex rosettiformis TaxID=378272 RepID=A0ACB8U366_9APHY|nr:hypothetical protein BDY19DRAFT_993606 [Irpex rosettiformis]
MPPFASPLNPIPYPALYLYPLNDSFIPKHISLINNQRVKIGRQTNAKTVPAERNGYFDSKVLSRQHAEVWEESGKIFIKDVKSSNGTFINSERLSAEGVESDPFELKTDDIVEFGIDIVGEDNKTIVHHKVAARVVCVFTEQDAQAAARAEAQQNPPTYGALGGQGPGVGGAPNAFSFAGPGPGGSNGIPGQPQRRTTMQPQGLVGMGGMGGGARQPGKSGLTFDHILSRLQGELQKSRETGAELHSLTGAMNEIHETLGGNLPPSHPPYPQTLPPVVPPQPSQPSDLSNGSPSNQAPAPRSSDSSSALSELQSQLHETQLSLAAHVDKIRTLENMLAEHEAIKQEVSAMREMMEERKREMELLRLRTQSPNQLRRLHSHVDDQADEYSSDDDDTRSISTVVPHELERVDEEDEDQIAAEEEEEERRRRSNEVRPRTPEPTGMGMQEDDEDHDPSSRQSAPTEPEVSARLHAQSPTATPAAVPDELAQRLTSLANQLESALELSRSLEAQHSTAQTTISVLESKVTALESLVQATQSQVQAQAETQQQLVQAAEAARTASAITHTYDAAAERESLTEMINEWKKNVEGKWDGVQEEWQDERERLRRAKEEWESRVRAVERGLETASSKLDSGLASLASFQALQRPQPNGHAKLNSSGGLVTPPSPRSLSAESTRPRQKKRRTSSTRGRTRSRSQSPIPLPPVEHDHDDASSSSSGLRRRTSWETESNDSEGASHPNGSTKLVEGEVRKSKIFQYPITPEPSLLEQPISGSSSLAASMTDTHTREPPKGLQHHPNSLNNASTAFGVIVVVAAAAAVMWRMKPDGS